jgi:hypothetical protein
MTTELDERLLRARPEIPQPSLNAVERIRRNVIHVAGTRSRVPRRRVVLAVVIALTGLAVAAAVGAPFVRSTLDRLSAWADGTPGEPSPAAQASFDAANAESFARFPRGTVAGLLLRSGPPGIEFELLGFRDGENLCVYLKVPNARRWLAPECVSRRELQRFQEPVAVLGGNLRLTGPNRSSFTVVYGLAADAVHAVRVDVDGTAGGPALLGANAFLYVADTPAGGVHDVPDVQVSWATADRASSTTLQILPLLPTEDPAVFPGPARVERTIDNGTIGWLERREPRGEPFEWPAQDRVQRVLYTRALQPDPGRTFRIAVARTAGTQWFTEGAWYCLTWLYPLVPTDESNMCTRASRIAHGLMYTGQWTSSVSEFALWIGLAADEVERLELIRLDGTSLNVPLLANTFTFQTRREEPTKLVAYDEQGRVVVVEFVGGRGGSLTGIAVPP